jgi:hypothetical protein
MKAPTKSKRRRRARSPQLTFQSYQDRAAKTDNTGDDPDDGVLVSVLGISGESGDLATLFKKRLRDGTGFTIYRSQCAEELGDILWYVANTSRRLGYTLESIAKSNLSKTRSRWGIRRGRSPQRGFLDDAFPKREQLPRKFTIVFKERTRGNRKRVVLFRNGRRCGDPLTDNSHFEDGYRFHDIFHLAFAAVLCWSPVTRKLLRCKRKSNKKVDEIEDGGRAAVIEEGLSALVFDYAEKHNFFDGLGHVDSEVLSTIKRLTDGLEVRISSTGEWENAILLGYKVFRLLNRYSGGIVDVDLVRKDIQFSRLDNRAR